jgi:hypothetical protein
MRGRFAWDSRNMMLKSFAAFAVFAAFLGSAWADIPPPMPEQPMAPNMFVEQIYADKLSAEAVSDEFGRAQTSALILQHFSPELLALYKSTYHAPEPIIDADVFMMAQDWDTKTVSATVKANNSSSATVEVNFVNFGEPRKVTYTLKLSPVGSWEIDNIGSSDWDLRAGIMAGMANASP